MCFKVVIYQASAPPAQIYGTINPPSHWWQLGAYFGQSVLGIDLNKDLYTDLLISAPLYADKRGFDHGRVFVYMNDPKKPGLSAWVSLFGKLVFAFARQR